MKQKLKTHQIHNIYNLGKKLNWFKINNLKRMKKI